MHPAAAQDTPVYAGLSVAGHLRTGAWLNPGWDGELAAPDRAWLGEVSSVVLQQALADLNTAYRNFFASAEPGIRRPQAIRPAPALERFP